MNAGSEPPADRPPRRLGDVPSALPWDGRLEKDLRGELAVFLDYDGTLTPIVDDPNDARLSSAMRQAIEALASAALVAIVSGRDLDDVREKVDIPSIAYAGSHGFDILHPDGTREQLGTDHADALDRAEQELEKRLAEIPGVRIERKRFAIAVHDRQIQDPATRSHIGEVVEGLAQEEAQLRCTRGKRIHELRPDIDWDKGRAIEELLSVLGARRRTPIYIGDDVTDEDGFRAVAALGGLAVVVRGEDDDRATMADAALESPDEARQFLEALLELARPGDR